MTGKWPPPAPDTQPHRLTQYRHRWGEVGIATFPLHQNEKKPVCDDWQTRLPADMWTEAERRPDTANSQHNIAVRAGQLSTRPDTSLAVIDMDNATSRRNATAHLASMGIDAATVRTASGSGRHAYLLASGVPDNFTWRKINKDIGGGELRAGRGAYVVAPCSEIDSTCYIFTAGNIETLITQPVVTWQDLKWLLPDTTQRRPRTRKSTHTDATTPPQVNALPVRLQRRNMPAHTLALLGWCANAKKGEGLSNYATRSEVEAAAVTQLIGCGWTLDEVRGAFEKHQPKHFTEQGSQRGRYIAHTFRRQVSWLSNTPIRLMLADLYAEVQTIPWEGRTGNTNRDVFLALIAHCYRFDTAAVYAAQRDLAEHAHSARQTVPNALKRLQEMGCVMFLEKADRTRRRGERWAVVGLPSTQGVGVISHKPYKGCLGSKGGSVREHTSAEADAGLAARLSGLWAVRGGLGRSCKAVCLHLSDKPQSVRDLISATGKKRKAVSRALAELSQLGIAEQAKRGGYVRGKVSLVEVAHHLGAEELTTRRRSRHTWEREAYAKLMKLSGGKV